MTKLKMTEVQLWMKATLRLMERGVLSEVVVDDHRGLWAVRGRYPDGTRTAPLAKYGRHERALDVAGVLNHLGRKG